MPIEITMPRLSDTMEAGTVIQWHVAAGDEVSAGDVLADVETDKATMEMQTFDDGTILELRVEAGDKVTVGTVIAVLREEGEEPGDAPAVDDVAADPPVVDGEAIDECSGTEDGPMRVSPVARRMADDHGVDVGSLSGSGPGGRVIKRDVLGAVDAAGETTAAARTTHEATVPQAPPPHAPSVPAAQAVVPAGWRTDHREPLSDMRQIIARRLVESKQTIPHYQVTMTFDMSPLLDMRVTLNEQLEPVGVKLTVTDFIIRCCALAMAQHPAMNASFGGDTILFHGAVNVGVAVSLPEERGGGLVVATLRDADQKSLRAISTETAMLAERARTRGLAPEEMADATFTISNLGMFGVEHFTAIINPPNSAILAVGAAIEKPVVRDGELEIGHEMQATLSLDHRVIDGAMAARYLSTLRDLIENPAALLV